MHSPIRILMIDDDEDDFIITRDIVSQVDHHKHIIEWASSYEDGIKKILQQNHDVYLVDYQLGANNGLDLVKEAISKGCVSPLLLLTGQNDIEIDKLAMKAGASGYLQKGKTSARHLESSIRYSIQNAKMLREIKMLNAELEKRVRDRTLVLEEAVAELNKTKDELSYALKKEKDLNDLKSRFVSMASHEFRTPLATILSSLALITKYSEQNEKEKQMKHCDKIKTSVNNLTDIINDVLSVSKLEEGKMPVAFEKFDAHEFITLSMAEIKIISKEGQEIKHTHAGEKIIIQDKKALRHILLNLVSNAIKFSPPHSPINIHTEILNGSFKLTVTDSGIGISEKDQEHLFERFFRAENASNIQGTGLGLNIVVKYIELLNGEIDFKSKLNKGTTFIVNLPAISLSINGHDFIEKKHHVKSVGSLKE